MAASRKTHLLETALTLFNQRGFHATGIDLVQAESGVSKTTMYKYFKTKDDLIKAVLELRHEQFNTWFHTRTLELAQLNYAGHPYGRLMAMFDTLDEWIHSDTFFGCNFINASAEFSDITHPIHAYAAEHKQELAEYICTYVPGVKGEGCSELAQEILLLIDGAIVCAHTSGIKDSAIRARKMMCLLVENAASQEDFEYANQA